ncbi:mechanosensitive ion channel [Deinococcus cellulosilyticus]|uniref:Uncharacterized protein n=1 Tax=Deinococcus cellulosilyticus (strain DSM 18568 / NBRC 106333 / KACC 11606 / 5516J-15) TaxID=1223518 RepID=A0A511NB19_DEIC1|nr:mechanosensitive ion channel [Deinococcus cellulosilyticus]GEM49756.1 hypothetical protein DC3_53910 [Deinococcus cellulosilyticus NBRC 106333 = KACC 11606]
MDTIQVYTQQFLNYLPHLLTALLLAVAAFVVATLARTLTVKGLRAAHVDERVAKHQQGEPVHISKTVGDIVYGLVLLFFLPGILGALGLNSLLAPATGFLNNFLSFIPRIFGAVIIMVIGAFVAKLLRSLVTNVAATAGVDRLTVRAGLPAGAHISNLLGIVVYGLVIIPFITAALDALNMTAITQPISDMLNRILAALPNIFAAAAVVALAFFIGRFVSDLVRGLLTSMDFDRLPQLLGFQPSGSPTTGNGTPSAIVGHIAHAAIVLFALVSAFELLHADSLAQLTRNFIQLIGQIALGMVIFTVGLLVANLLAGVAARASGANGRLLAGVARWSTIALFGAMALRQMGIANEIVNLAFGLTLGAIAVAFALAFGLGSRETAGKITERWRQQLEKPGNTTGPSTASSAFNNPTD